MKNSQGIEIDDSKVIGMLIAYVQEYIECDLNKSIEQIYRETIIKAISDDLLSRGVAVEWEL